jgi:hypothetical protein
MPSCREGERRVTFLGGIVATVLWSWSLGEGPVSTCVSVALYVAASAKDALR